MDYHIQSNVWKQIFLKLHKKNDIRAKDEKKTRLFIEAIWYVMRTGCQWRLLPTIYGGWRAIHMRFKSWSDKGVWQYLFEGLQDVPDMEGIIIDGTIIRAHACSSGYKKDSQVKEALGRSKGGFTTKIHALVDALGNPLKFILTPGQRNEITQAEELLQNVRNTMVIADKGYDSNTLILNLEKQKCVTVIPPKKNRKVQREYDKHIYKERHLIECFFGKIKHFRRIFARFDKTASVFLSFLHFAGALIWAR